MSGETQPEPASAVKQGDRRELARGAGLAFLGRAGALIEAASFPLYLWLYGSVMFGIYATLWAVIRIGTGFTQMGMDVALQRFLPGFSSETDVHRSVGIAIVLSGVAGLAGAAGLVAAAPWLTVFTQGATSLDRATAIGVIRLYAWLLPLWTLLEILTACVRARRKFGPEIRIRSFYEQAIRITLALAFFALGLKTYGLFAAHVASMGLSAALAYRLLGRFFDRRRIFTAGFDIALFRRMLHYALPMVPATLIQRFFSELPVVLLNVLVPGAAGAASAGYYSIARKISSFLQVIHTSFDYVIAPLAAYRAGAAGVRAVADMYAYSTRLMVAIGLLAAAAVLAARGPLLEGLGAAAGEVATALAILVLGRLFSFLFGQAPAIIRTIASTYWSLANGVAGLAVMVGLLLFLAGPYGTAGAATAAAAGMVTSAGLAFLEVALIARIVPYTREMLRPVGVAALLGGILLLVGGAVASLPAAAQFAVLFVVFLLSLAAFVRYGPNDEDAVAFGRPGHVLRRGRRRRKSRPETPR